MYRYNYKRRLPLENTSKTTMKSMELIRKHLMRFAAITGFYPGEDFNSGDQVLRFTCVLQEDPNNPGQPDPKSPPFTISLRIYLDLIRNRMRETHPRIDRARIDEQAKRTSWAVLERWIEANMTSIEYGILRFEDVFLSHFSFKFGTREVRIGDIILPQLHDGRITKLLTEGR